MMETAQHDTWTNAGASVRGVGHVKQGIVCQDAHAIRVAGDVLIFAVCDGAGSAPMSQLGSRAAADGAVDAVARELAQGTPTTGEDWRTILERARVEALAAVQEQANAAGLGVRDLATTLLLAVAAPGATAVLQIGDGAVVGEDLAERSIVALTRPETGEYANETVFLTMPGVDPQVCIGPPVRALAVFSDGLQRLALQMPEGVPHEAFFRPLFRFIDSEDGTDRSGELSAFLTEPRVVSRSDDDITLLVGARRPA